ncbi:hypothetical protein PoB_003687400 [Plakobranchus ocellatus]|uniref:Uncharacterized protein n=1 Tax=Plakobranchus ocellatus TaxID=259542 RepID=A0AAV4ARE3_9GAST|nr:hypothetical protein PoB_003687400 [Plakobranchus ocellatus]
MNVLTLPCVDNNNYGCAVDDDVRESIRYIRLISNVQHPVRTSATPPAVLSKIDTTPKTSISSSHLHTKNTLKIRRRWIRKDVE